MTSSSGQTIESDCEMKESNALVTSLQETNQIQEHSDTSAKKRKVTERLCVSCNEILTGQKTMCQCCAGCCNSTECRSQDHIMVKQLKQREKQMDELRRTGMSADSIWKLVGADSPRHQPKRAKQGEKNEMLEVTKTTEQNERALLPEKTKTTKKGKSDAKQIEKISEKKSRRKPTRAKRYSEEDKHDEGTEKESIQLITRLKERVDELEKLCRKFQAEIEVLQKSRHDKQIIRESPVKIVTDETKQHEKRLQEIEKQVKNLNISSHKESAARYSVQYEVQAHY
jgi:hypothetical protein